MEEKIELSNKHSIQFTTVLFIGLGTVFLFWCLQFYWKKRHMYLLSRKTPGPSGWPLIGVALELVGNNADLFEKIEMWFDKYPNLFSVWLGPNLFYGISNPKHIEILLTRSLKKGFVYGFLEDLVGHGLLTAPVNKWKKHRKSIMPTFNQRILNGFVEVFKQQSDELIEQMGKFDGKGEFDVFQSISNYSMDSVCENIMGLQVNAQTSEFLYGKWIETIGDIVFKRMCSVWYQFEPIFQMSNGAKVMKDCIEKALSFTDQIIIKKKEAYKKDQEESKGEEYREAGTKKKILLDYLFKIEDEGNGVFSDKDLRDEVTTLIIASTDTSTTGVCFALTMLGLHPEIQAKVYNEIMEVIGPNRDVEYSDLPHLKYMEMVIKEALRLFPPVPFVIRTTEEDVDLGDYIVSKEAEILISIKKVQTDEKYWPNPYMFIPERFLPDEVAQRHPCASIPFSYGPRNCVGYRYGIMSTKVLLAKVIMNYEIFTSYKSVEDVKVKCNIMLRPVEGYKVSIKSRSR